MKARWLKAILNQQMSHILYPRLCCGCTHALENAVSFCESCRDRIASVTNPCRLCGLENKSNDEICAVCLYDPPRWQKMIAPLAYQGLTRELLMQFKFGESLHHVKDLTGIVKDRFSQSTPNPQILIPVPLHHNRLMQRGFNQAYEIARQLSRHLNIPLDKNSLQRVRETEAQAGLSAYARERNIVKAFHFENHLGFQHVAVVDDIVTTGSTANEITKVLHRAGVEQVEIWSLARVTKL